MPPELGARLAAGLLVALGAACLFAALILGLARWLGPEVALVLVGALCLTLAALGLRWRRKAPNPAAELGMLLGILALRVLVRRG